MIHPSLISHILTLLKLALAEDKVAEDVTSQAIFAPESTMRSALVAREPLVFAGAELFPLLAGLPECSLEFEAVLTDGSHVSAGEVLAVVSGSTLEILAYERVLLNLLQRLCGVATLTHRYVNAIAGTAAVILDTRKTMPGWRALDKYAVRCGGGQNHRMDLASEVMVKDNHIAAAGSIVNAIQKVLPLKASRGLTIVVECDTLEQVAACLCHPIDRILLDNMSPEMLKAAVELVAGCMPLEASGGVTLETIAAIAQTGVQYISVGAITHSAVAMDIGMDAT